jgi:predicted amidophosphoribosyltransferase
MICPSCEASIDPSVDVLDPCYECASGHYFTWPEADESNLCPECSRFGRRIGVACPACREPILSDAAARAS